MTETQDVGARVRRVFELLTGRRPGESEFAVLEQLFREQLEDFTAHPERAGALLAVGEHPASASLEPAELAATTVLAQTVLCYDETVTKR